MDAINNNGTINAETTWPS